MPLLSHIPRWRQLQPRFARLIEGAQRRVSRAIGQDKPAQDQASATKATTLEQLRKNSHEAANAVRALTDDELDQAAPFSLSFGAPMTAQFVIEDHALRHSWHHLAKIRAPLGR